MDTSDSGLDSKITHFVATIKETSAKGLARLFRDNV